MDKSFNAHIHATAISPVLKKMVAETDHRYKSGAYGNAAKRLYFKANSNAKMLVCLYVLASPAVKEIAYRELTSRTQARG